MTGGRVRVAYVDTETTGLSSRFDRIIELAVVLAEVDGETGVLVDVLDRYDGLQDPGRPIPWGARAVHGITDAMVKGHRIDAGRATALLAAADLRLAHNSGFDKGFVAQVIPGSEDLLWGCTCRGIPWKRLDPRVPSMSLQDLSRHFGTPRGTAHRALGDVETTLALVASPRLEDGHAFQRELLHTKLRRSRRKRE